MFVFEMKRQKQKNALKREQNGQMHHIFFKCKQLRAIQTQLFSIWVFFPMTFTFLKAAREGGGQF